MREIVEITLNTLTYGGEAMGRLQNGSAVFVPFCLPGETVRARVVFERKNFARAELLEVLKPAPERIAPRCRHFGLCGGCHYQHLAYADQLKAKQAILRDQLTRIGKIQDPPVKAIVAAPDEWHYRNHVQFHLDENGKLGFVSAASTSTGSVQRPDAVIPISECFLPAAGIDAFWPTLDFEPGSSIERVSLRAGVDDDLLLVLESEQVEVPELEIEADISVIHLTEEDAVVLAGDDHLVIEVLGRPFKVSAASFFQVNTPMAGKMVEHLLDLTGLTDLSGLTILDVYCGAGLFGAFLASRVARVIGIESAPSSCEDFAVNLDEFENVELYEGLAEEILPNLVLNGSPTHSKLLAIVDPPRAGLDKNALDALLALKPATLAYVSCDPSTLARDAARLIAGGYQLKQVTPFDLFPQTYHIESISLFTRT
jgi:23S rRNA (uracil1939-C5)-methyltransferase